MDVDHFSDAEGLTMCPTSTKWWLLVLLVFGAVLFGSARGQNPLDPTPVKPANPDKKAESGAGKLMSRLTGLFKKEEPLSADDLARLKDVDLHVLIYGRLLEKETVSDEALQALARHRTQAVVAALAAAGAPKERVVAAGIERYEGDARDVPVKLELGVAK